MAVQHRDPQMPTKKMVEIKGNQNSDFIGIFERTVEMQAKSWQQEKKLLTYYSINFALVEIS